METRYERRDGSPEQGDELPPAPEPAGGRNGSKDSEPQRINLFARLKETRTAFRNEINPFEEWADLDTDLFPPPPPAGSNAEPDGRTVAPRGDRETVPEWARRLQWDPPPTSGPEDGPNPEDGPESEDRREEENEHALSRRNRQEERRREFTPWLAALLKGNDRESTTPPEGTCSTGNTASCFPPPGRIASRARRVLTLVATTLLLAILVFALLLGAGVIDLETPQFSSVPLEERSAAREAPFFPAEQPRVRTP